jgi:hypothetical protein
MILLSNRIIMPVDKYENGTLDNENGSCITQENVPILLTYTDTIPLYHSFIRDKYERRKYFDAAVLHRLVTLGEDSFDSASGDNRGQQELEDTTVRQPSEAAKLRAEHRRNRLTNHTNSSLSDTSRPTVVQIPPKVAKPIHGEPQITTAPTQPIVDLLDFSFISTPAKDMDPPPRPPSVQASPNLDLFKSLTLNDAPATSTTTTSTTTDSHDIFGDIYNRKSAASSSVPNPFPSQQEQKKTLTSNEILAMFNSSSLAQPHVHPSTSTPNLNTSSRFDFFDHIPIAKSGQPSSLTSATTTHHLHTHHSFSSTNQTVMQGTGGTLGRPPPNTPYSIHSFMQESSTFSMSHTIPNQIHGTFVPMGPTSSIPRPMNMPTAPPTYTYGGSPNTQTNHSESFPRATESVHPGYPMPMGGMTNHSSVMGGVEHGSDAFTVMGGGDNDPSSKNSNSYSNFGALNSFR